MRLSPVARAQARPRKADLTKGQEIRRYRRPGHIESLAFDQSGQRLFLGTQEGNIEIHNVETGNQLGALVGHTFKVFSLRMLPGNRLVSTAFDDSIRLWDLTRGKEIDCVSQVGKSAAFADVSPDGRRLVCGAGWKTVMHMERYNEYRLRQFLLPAR